MRRGLIGAAALSMLVAAAAKTEATGESTAPVTSYRMAPDAQELNGSETTADAPLLKPGAHTYKDRVEPGQRKHYAVQLDADSSAYVSAVAVPRPGDSMGARDGISVSLEAMDGTQCGVGRHRTFLSAGGAYPVADYAERVAGAGGACKAAGTYRFVVERGDASGGDPTAVPVELKYVSVPANSASASDPAGDRTAPAAPGPGGGGVGVQGGGVQGGSGFNDAAEIRPGVWKDQLRPGETHFYRVPVGAGEQLAAEARFGSAPDAAGPPYVITGVRMGLSNAARGYVMNKTGGYQGKPATLSLTTPAAAGDTGGAGGDAARGMRLAGWYYLQVSLNPKVGQGNPGRVPVTLTVDVGKARKEARQPGGSTHPTAAVAVRHRDGRLRAVGYAGVTTGSLLLLGLGGWTLAARRGGE
ncbi:hypothetical protein QZH56_11470 [Streptomyces olivoreticuli]|uniref:hypothetical protein n=1 Tax=Streptomyces olivoreticuli TaxID=68246 RepID=UPI002657DE4B|nr:hypothetical protein [Streptomyces olivoreticuli]WKK26153.1 hypothetical protein QZH56_11470 [Streptomyces olivoreticuli]